MFSSGPLPNTAPAQPAPYRPRPEKISGGRSERSESPVARADGWRRLAEGGKDPDRPVATRPLSTRSSRHGRETQEPANPMHTRCDGQQSLPHRSVKEASREKPPT
jgi:hypothetical protein